MKRSIMLFVFMVLMMLSSAFAQEACNEVMITTFMGQELKAHEQKVEDKLNARFDQYETTTQKTAMEFYNNIENLFVRASIFVSLIVAGMITFAIGLFSWIRLKKEGMILSMLHKDSMQNKHLLEGLCKKMGVKVGE